MTCPDCQEELIEVASVNSGAQSLMNVCAVCTHCRRAWSGCLKEIHGEALEDALIDAFGL